MFRLRLISLLCAALIGFAPFSMRGQAPFVSVTDDMHVVTNNLEGFWGPGMSAWDVNGDGWDDLTFGDFFGGANVFLNEGGTFAEEPLVITPSEPCETKSAVWGDVDNDGDQDLYMGCRFDPNRFFLNTGNMELVDVTETCGLNGLSASSWGGAWVDFNRDGFLDLIVANYTSPYDYPNELYLGNGDGTFEEVDITDYGMLSVARASFQHHWLDMNGDDVLDVYVINDRFNDNESYLGVSAGLGLPDTLASTPDSMGLNASGDLMGETWLDVDLDGDLEVYIANSSPHGNKLLEADSTGVYMNRAAELGIDLYRQSWGVSAGDWNNDGWEDLYVSTSNWTYYYVDVFDVEPVDNAIFQNTGGTWSSWESLTPELDVQSFSHAACDWNRDGSYDLCVYTCDSIASMLQGVPNGNAWLDLVPQGTTSNADGIGWIVHAYTTAADGNVTRRTRQLAAGESFMMQRARRLHFGLGATEVVDSLYAVWPSGLEEWLYDIPTNLQIDWVEGATLVESAGCTYAGACNYDAFATSDDGTCDLSCLVPECPDLSSACGPGTQWDSVLQMCLPEEVCWHDSDQDGNVTTQDLLGLLSVYGSVCP